MTLTKKIDSLKNKLVNNDIESQTYKKWYKCFKMRSALPQAEMEDLNRGYFFKWKQAENKLGLLTDIPGLFNRANVFQNHFIIKKVFKDGLMYKGCSYRIPSKKPAL